MEYLLFYWLVAGFALYAAYPGPREALQIEILAIVFCLALGGILVPAKLLAKLIS